jgi:hypothetical protein
MFERVATGWELAKQSLQVLKLDKELLLFPLLSGVACLLVAASFAIPLWASGYADVLAGEEAAEASNRILGYLLLFLFYLANYFVIIFFNSALVACAIIRFKGGNPNLKDGLSAASSRLPLIFGWAVVTATVGLILRIIESRSERVGQIVAGLLGMAWSAVTYFVVPVIVVEKLGPVAATRRSLSILKKTWGEALTANFGIGLIVFVATLVSMIPIVLGAIVAAKGMVSLGVALIACGILLVLLVSLVSSALNSIIVGALYLYAAEGTVPQQFDDRLFQHAFAEK